MPSLSPNHHRTPTTSRRRWVLTVFGLWLGLAVAVFGWMGKLPCGLPRGVLAEKAWTEPGWRAEHRLTAATDVEARVVDHLLARGPLPGLPERVSLSGDAQAFAPALENAGWTVVGEDEFSTVPSLGVALWRPDGELAWQARHDGPGLLVAGAAPLDTAAFRAVLRGDSLPPQVPAGCGL
ncbi:hypothetical protein [Actomonas aquatica]|uniref:Uncharacterized protein n=1 Tax=Actomonas aquatica TaxID=2866162 RepID=A0ABZ1C5R1_9BACT|nr:hypothetical protein [Opitutus sp. WL0086]WRQ85635.1 hypothetical protein K1X11_012555 [Opitutus sp. WL0086]